MKDVVKATLEELLGKLLVEKYDLEMDEQEDGVIQINIETEESPLLIGKHGVGLASLQQLLNLILRGKAEEGMAPRVRIDVGGYMAQFEERILDLAKRKAERVLEEDIRETLHPMNSYHRRMVHMYLLDAYPEILTESIGAEPNRRIILKRKEEAESSDEEVIE